MPVWGVRGGVLHDSSLIGDWHCGQEELISHCGLLEGQGTPAVSWAGRPIGGARKASGVSPGCPFGTVTSEDLILCKLAWHQAGRYLLELTVSDWSKLGQLGVPCLCVSPTYLVILRTNPVAFNYGF